MATNLEYIYRLKDQYSKKMATMIAKQDQFIKKHAEATAKISKGIDLTNKKIGKQISAFKNVNSTMDQTRQRVRENTTAFRRHNTAITQSAQKIQNLQRKNEAFFRSSRKGLESVNRKWQQHRQKMATQKGPAGGRLAQAATGVGAGLVLGSILGDVTEFQTFKNMLESQGKLTEKQMSDMEKHARKWGMTTEFTNVQVMQAMGEAGQAGMGYEKIIGSIPGAMDFASTAQIDLAEAIIMTTDVVAQYGLNVKDNTRIADNFAVAQANSTGKVVQFGAATQRTGLIARKTGVNIEETTILLMRMAEAGLRGEEAGTMMKNFFKQLKVMKPDKIAALGKTFAKTGENFKDFFDVEKREFTDVRGFFKALDKNKDVAKETEKHFQNEVRALQGFMAMMAPTEERAKQMADAIDNASGSAEKMRNVALKGIVGALKSLKSAFSEIKMSMIDSFVTPGIKAMEFLTEFMRSLIDNHKWVLKLAFVGLTLTAAITGLGISLFVLGTAFKSLALLTVVVTGPLKLYNMLVGISTVATGANTMALKGNVVALRAARVWSLLVAKSKTILLFVLGGWTKALTLSKLKILAHNAVMKMWRATILLLKFAVSGFTLTWKILSIAFKANPIGFVITMVAGLITAFLILKKKTGSVSGAFMAMGQIILKGMLIPLNLVTDAIILLLRAASKLPGIGGSLGKAAEGLEGMQDKVNKFLTSSEGAFDFGGVIEHNMTPQKRAEAESQRLAEKRRKGELGVTVNGEVGVKAEPGTKVIRNEMDFGFNLGGNLAF